MMTSENWAEHDFLWWFVDLKKILSKNSIGVNHGFCPKCAVESRLFEKGKKAIRRS
jgi:hypothetical protein